MTDQIPSTPMTPDPATPATPAATPPAGDPPVKPADVTPPADDQLLFKTPDPEKKEGDPADPPADADKKDGEGDDKKDGDKSDEPLKVEDFQLEDGFVIPEETKTELEGIINNKELSEKDKLQGLINLHQKVMKSQMQGFQEFREQLREATKNDPFIGGDKLPQAIKEADNAVYQLTKNPKFGGSDELYNGFVQRLTLLGLGDDPFVIRFLNNTNKILSQFKDDSLDGGNSGGEEQKSVENILWGKKS